MNVMLFWLRSIGAFIWLVAAIVAALGWYFDEPVGPGQRAWLALAVVYVFLDLTMRAVDSAVAVILARHRHLDRRHQI